VVQVDGQNTFVYRDENGAAVGVLDIVDGKVDTLFVHATHRGEGISEQLYRAADDAGIDVGKLGAKEVTPEGEMARASYLRRRAKEYDINGGDLPGRPDTATTYRRTKSGGVRQSRLFRSRKPKISGEDGTFTVGEAYYVLKDGAVIVAPIRPPRNLANSAAAGEKAAVHAANAGQEIGTVVGRRAGEPVIIITPNPAIKDAYKVGDLVPGTFGRIEEIAGNKWVIRADPTLFKSSTKTAESALPVAGGLVSGARAADGNFPTTAPDGTPIPDALQARAAEARRRSQPAPGYTPGTRTAEAPAGPAAASSTPSATTPAQTADPGQGNLFGGADPDAPQALFDRGSVPLEDLPDTNPYPPRPTVGKDVGRLDPSTLPDINTSDLDEQQILIGLGFVLRR
jgi:hypothetical protein